MCVCPCAWKGRGSRDASNEFESEIFIRVSYHTVTLSPCVFIISECPSFPRYWTEEASKQIPYGSKIGRLFVDSFNRSVEREVS